MYLSHYQSRVVCDGHGLHVVLKGRFATGATLERVDGDLWEIIHMTYTSIHDLECIVIAGIGNLLFFVRI